MKPEFSRVKNDLDTIQNAMGLARSPAREWIRWLKRDRWLYLWWCIPGAMLMAASLLPASNLGKYCGYTLAEWTRILVAAVAGGILIVSIRRTTANDGRPPSLIREYRRFWGLDTHGKWASLALLLGCLLYVLWAWHFRIRPEAFGPGICILAGSTYLVVAVVTRLWLLAGVAIPLLGYGLLGTLLPGMVKAGGIPLGIMCIGMGLSCYLIQVWQIRKVERQHEPH